MKYAKLSCVNAPQLTSGPWPEGSYKFCPYFCSEVFLELAV